MTLADLPDDMRRQAELQMLGSFVRPLVGPVSEVEKGCRGGALFILPENDIQKASEAWLRSMGCIVFHMPGKAAIGNMRGFPDILALCPGGRTLLVELKSAKGKRSDAQMKFADSAAVNGHFVYLCYSLDDVKAAYCGPINQRKQQ